ncbi:MAG: hypothetical protein RL086_442 [Bacteroidota bacterium]|jgi:hypothetical protein
MPMSLKYFISVVFISVLYTSISQIQKGFDINGESAGDNSGSVSMPDMNTVAIGANWNDGNGSNSGHARVFTWSGSTWIQKGADIDGESAQDNQAPVDMPDANTIVVGSMFNDNGGQEAGQVRVFYWDGSSWIQKGQNINGTVVGGAFGRNVCMPDANTVAAVGNCDYSSQSLPDFVRVFQWNGNSWVQKGSDILGWNTFGGTPSIDMPDANTIGIQFRAVNSGVYIGKSRVYVWNGISWIQKGMDIDGTDSEYSVSMPDVNTIALAENEYNGFFGYESGRVRIFKYEGNSWVQKGSDIQGEAPYDWFGTSISMPNSNTISVVARGSDINGSDSGNTYLFSFNGTHWVQLVNIVGEFFNDGAGGCDVSMPDATTIAIGASANDGNGDGSGHVRVFSLTTNGIQTNQEITKNIRVYPNPANDVVKIDCSYEIEKIEMIDTRGVLLFQSTENKKEFFLPENTQSGCYVLVIHTPEGFYRQKLFIQK